MIMSMRTESGEIASDRDEILKICVNFYKSLYTQTVPTPESTMKSSPDTEKNVCRRSSEKSHKKDEKTQSPRNGWNHKTYYKTREAVVLTYLTNIFNNILKTMQIPKS